MVRWGAASTSLACADIVPTMQEGAGGGQHLTGGVESVPTVHEGAGGGQHLTGGVDIVPTVQEGAGGGQSTSQGVWTVFPGGQHLTGVRVPVITLPVMIPLSK